jgi:hypothetical protein
MVLPWLLWSSAHAAEVPALFRGSYGTYGPWFLTGLHEGGLPFVVATIRTNLDTLFVGISTAFRFRPGAMWDLITGVPLALLWLYGAWRVRRRAPVTLVFLALYLGLVVAWPFQPLRFVWGVWPLLMVLLVVPLADACAADRARWQRVTLAVLGLVLLPGLVRYTARGYRGEWWASIPRSASAQAETAARWVRVHTKRADIIAAEQDPYVYLYSGRQAVPFVTFTALQYLRPRTAAEDGRFLRQIVKTSGAKYVLVQTLGEFAAARAMEADTSAAPYLVLTDSTAGLFAFRVTDTRPMPASAPGTPPPAPSDSAGR